MPTRSWSDRNLPSGNIILMVRAVSLKVLAMLDVEIPGFGRLRLEYLVCDFTGTISVDGKLLPMAKGKLNEIAGLLKTLF